ncbi:MAG: hypothetical protein DI582_10985 [Azospirillum brasilense]|nr:MAG: hypothetical protein DI582_10985 [Azospirillum brasilense]
MKKSLITLLACATLSACSSDAGKPQYLLGLQIIQTPAFNAVEPTQSATAHNLKIDICFRDNEEGEPLCYRNVKTYDVLRIRTESDKLALASITLLGEKPYGDKNYYYAWSRQQLPWTTLSAPADRVFLGRLQIAFGPRQGDDYPPLGVAAYCDPKLHKTIEDQEKATVPQNCLNIGSVEKISDNLAESTMKPMPPKVTYRPFGRDPDVPFGELPADAPRYHE